MRKLLNAKTVTGIVLITLIGSVATILFKMIFTSAPTETNLVPMLLFCLLGVGAILLPIALKRKTHVIIPSFMLVIYAVFLYCAIFLGEVQAFYYKVPNWDTILHTFSGFALCAVGFSIVGLLQQSKILTKELSPMFVAVFTFFFAVFLGVAWEIFEFTADALLHTNMQKCILESGEMLSGAAAVADTMKDLIVDTFGALTMSVVGYVSLKYKKGWLRRFELTFDRNYGKVPTIPGTTCAS